MGADVGQGRVGDGDVVDDEFRETHRFGRGRGGYPQGGDGRGEGRSVAHEVGNGAVRAGGEDYLSIFREMDEPECEGDDDWFDVIEDAVDGDLRRDGGSFCPLYDQL